MGQVGFVHEKGAFHGEVVGKVRFVHQKGEFGGEKWLRGHGSSTKQAERAISKWSCGPLQRAGALGESAHYQFPLVKKTCGQKAEALSKACLMKVLMVIPYLLASAAIRP